MSPLLVAGACARIGGACPRAFAGSSTRARTFAGSGTRARAGIGRVAAFGLAALRPQISETFGERSMSVQVGIVGIRVAVHARIVVGIVTAREHAR